MYENFKQHVHGEFVDKDTFKQILKSSGVENEHVAEHWFEVCDPNHDGKLVFKYDPWPHAVVHTGWFCLCWGDEVEGPTKEHTTQ